MSSSLVIPCAISALIGSYITWAYFENQPIEQPVVTIPPLLFEQQGDQLLVWGGWAADAGSRQPGRNAVEIRCYRAQGVCTEAVASVAHHDEGADIEAQSYLYRITEWRDQRLLAVATGTDGDCSQRRLLLNIEASAGSVEWSAPPGCDSGSGTALLIGDPL